MSSAQDPSAYYNKAAGSGLWSDQGAMATPYLYNPGAASAAGYTAGQASSAVSPWPSVNAPTPGVTNATSQGILSAAAPAGVSAIATPATRSAMASPAGHIGLVGANSAAAVAPTAAATATPTPGSYQVPGTAQAPAGYTVSVGQGTGPKAIAPNLGQPLGYTVVPDSAPKYVANTVNGDIVAYYQWDPVARTYQYINPNDFAALNVQPGNVQSVEGDIAAYGQGEAALAAAAQKQTQDNAISAAAQNAAAAPAPTAQDSNFNFTNSFSQTPQANTAIASAGSAQNALASQLSTNSYQSGNIAAAGRYGASQEVSASGQNQLAIQGAQAADTDQNLAALGNAMASASSNASNETGAQANADVSAIQDDVSALQSQLSTLDAGTQARANAQLTSLQNQINQYQEAVAKAGADSALAKSIFNGILAAGAAVAVIATGGTAAVAIGAAGAASAAGRAA